MDRSSHYIGVRWRFFLTTLLLSVLAGGLFWRMIDLMVLQRPFLLGQSQQRMIRKVRMPAHRGMITDRRGRVLAVSTPVNAVWSDPRLFRGSSSQKEALARCLAVDLHRLESHLRRKHRSFVYLKRSVVPSMATCVKRLRLPGIFMQQSFHRYYPHGAASAHVLGRTNIDDRGQEGLELAYDGWLAGVSGKRWVLRDRLGRVIEQMSVIKTTKPGHSLQLSLDQRLQYAVFRHLSDTVSKVHAKSGSAIVLDVRTGGVLAMANVPSYNPNHPPKHGGARYRNRAITDVFEPGSTMKPFALASALLSGRYRPDTKVNTNPGIWIVQGHRITDEGLNYGHISLTEVLQKSSNIGMSKITLSLPASHLLRTFERFGFGRSTESGFPGEAAGSMVYPRPKQSFVLATLSFGYGLSTTLLQLARAYAILARLGLDRPVHFLLSDQRAQTPAKRVIPAVIAKQIVTMLSSVVRMGGTGYLAHVPGYQVAGKTGTAYVANAHGYDKKHYIASFAGIAPVSQPRFVVVVMINQPSIRHHYGGLVAAPTFAKIMGEALKIWDIKPDLL